MVNSKRQVPDYFDLLCCPRRISSAADLRGFTQIWKTFTAAFSCFFRSARFRVYPRL